jgi:hypothetical protein
MKFKVEADLCAAFIARAKDSGWTVFPEQNEWDFIMMKGKVQVGVQAKLKANREVLCQTLPKLPYNRVGPQYRAVLVGGFTGRTRKAQYANRRIFYNLAAHLKIVVFDTSTDRWFRYGWYRNAVNIGRYRNFKHRLNYRHYHWKPKEIEWVPNFEPTLAAGVPSPKTISKWKLAILDLRELELEKGFICKDDCIHIIEKYETKWNYTSLLNKFWSSTGKRVEGSRQTKWTLRYKHYDPNIIFKDIKDMR